MIFSVLLSAMFNTKYLEKRKDYFHLINFCQKQLKNFIFGIEKILIFAEQFWNNI